MQALLGKRVLITRAGKQSEAFARSLRTRGAEPIVAPTIVIEAPDDPLPAQRAIEALASYDWLVFTSQNGVDAFFARRVALHADARAMGATRVAAIGPGTAERLRDYGVRSDLMPDTFVGEEVARALIEHARPGDRVLLYCAQDARDALPRMLEAAGLRATVVAAYKTVFARTADFEANVARSDVLTFTSASTVRGFLNAFGNERAAAAAAHKKCIACIGPITARSAREAGLNVDVVASIYTTAGLLDAVESYFAMRT